MIRTVQCGLNMCPNKSTGDFWKADAIVRSRGAGYGEMMTESTERLNRRRHLIACYQNAIVSECTLFAAYHADQLRREFHMSDRELQELRVQAMMKMEDGK
jgi:alkylhydroperoxidase family enzyme